MLKGIFGILLFIIALAVFILLLTGGLILKKFRDIRDTAKKAAENQAYQHRSETGRQQRQYHYTKGTQQSQSSQQSQRSYQDYQEEEQPRRTQTDTGETIIDHRENKKIFEHTDGEYVEFTEE